MEITRLFDIPLYQQREKPLEEAFATKVNGKWLKTSTHTYLEQVNALSRGFLNLGIKPNDKIAIVTANNRTEWNIVDIGLQQIGAVTVPLYPTLSADDFEFVLNNSQSVICFVSNQSLYNTVNSIKDKLPNLKHIYTFDNVENADHWESILKLGENTDKQNEVEELKKNVKPIDVVTMIYTSGTTGRPKGVVLTHENLVSNVLYSYKRIPHFDKNSIALSFLPINHVFERMLIYLYQYIGLRIYYAESVDMLGENMKEVKPHVMTVVPRLLEKVYDKIYLKGTTSGGLKSKIFLWAISLVENYNPYAEKNLWFNIKYSIANKIVFSKWREGVGGNIVAMVSGSAALNPRLSHIFWGAGIPILEGYGLTETSPVIAVNKMEKGLFGIGTVGAPLDNLDVKIAEDGEILVKGPSVFKEYYNDPEKTKETFTEDGYFKTGDIGVIENGLLRITDRKKEMFKTSGGKYIAPQVIENIFKQSRFIEQVMVVGEGEKMPCAIIKPNFDVLKDYLRLKNLTIPATNEELIAIPQILDVINRDIDKMNVSLGNWEKIKKFELTPDEWTIEEGLLTPTLKLKRKAVLEKYKHLYEKLYKKEN